MQMKHVRIRYVTCEMITEKVSFVCLITTKKMPDMFEYGQNICLLQNITLIKVLATVRKADRCVLQRPQLVCSNIFPYSLFC